VAGLPPESQWSETAHSTVSDKKAEDQSETAAAVDTVLADPVFVDDVRSAAWDIAESEDAQPRELAIDAAMADESLLSVV